MLVLTTITIITAICTTTITCPVMIMVTIIIGGSHVPGSYIL
jgi:hypothetical protein